MWGSPCLCIRARENFVEAICSFSAFPLFKASCKVARLQLGRAYAPSRETQRGKERIEENLLPPWKHLRRVRSHSETNLDRGRKGAVVACRYPASGWPNASAKLFLICGARGWSGRVRALFENGWLKNRFSCAAGRGACLLPAFCF